MSEDKLLVALEKIANWKGELTGYEAHRMMQVAGQAIESPDKPESPIMAEIKKNAALRMHIVITVDVQNKERCNIQKQDYANGVSKRCRCRRFK